MTDICLTKIINYSNKYKIVCKSQKVKIEIIYPRPKTGVQASGHVGFYRGQ